MIFTRFRQPPIPNLQDIYGVLAVSLFEFTRHLQDLNSAPFSLFDKAIYVVFAWFIAKIYKLFTLVDHTKTHRSFLAILQASFVCMFAGLCNLSKCVAVIFYLQKIHGWTSKQTNLIAGLQNN